MSESEKILSNINCTLQEIFIAYPDIQVDAKDISSYAEAIGIKISSGSVEKKLSEIYGCGGKLYPYDIKKKKLEVHESYKWIVSLDKYSYEKLGKYDVKKSFLRRLQDSCPHNFYLEDYEFLDKTEDLISPDEVEDLKKSIEDYVKKKELVRPACILCAPGIGPKKEIISRREQNKIEKYHHILRESSGESKNKKKILKQLDWLAHQWGYEKNIHFRPSHWKPTEEGYSFDTTKEVSDDEKVHLTSPILHELKTLDSLSEHELAQQLDKPIFSILHGLEVLSGKKTKSCPYKILGYNCLQMPKLVKKIRFNLREIY